MLPALTQASTARREPTFVGIGAQKCGSSSLYDFLISAGVASGKKELHYFSRANPTREEYLSELDPGEDQEFFGEFTPDYLSSATTLHTLSEYLTVSKLIIILRNPVDRFYSSANHARGEGIIPAAWNARKLLETAVSGRHRNDWLSSLVSKGLFGGQVELALRLFPAERVFVCFLEEMSLPDLGPALLGRLLDFLGISGDGVEMKLPHHNSANFQLRRGVHGPLQPDSHVDQALEELFAQSNSLLRNVLGRSLPWDI